MADNTYTSLMFPVILLISMVRIAYTANILFSYETAELCRDERYAVIDGRWLLMYCRYDSGNQKPESIEIYAGNQINYDYQGYNGYIKNAMKGRVKAELTPHGVNINISKINRESDEKRFKCLLENGQRTEAYIDFSGSIIIPPMKSDLNRKLMFDGQNMSEPTKKIHIVPGFMNIVLHAELLGSTDDNCNYPKVIWSKDGDVIHECEGSTNETVCEILIKEKDLLEGGVYNYSVSVEHYGVYSTPYLFTVKYQKCEVREDEKASVISLSVVLALVLIGNFLYFVFLIVKKVQGQSYQEVNLMTDVKTNGVK